MKLDKDTIRCDREALVAELTQAGAKFRGNACNCVFHDDHTPSAGVFEREGFWFFKCQACGAKGDVFDIRGKLAGTTPAQEIRKALRLPEKQKRQHLSFANLDAVRNYLSDKVGAIISEHAYPTASGDTVQIQFRCERDGAKTYRPVHLSDAGYILGAGPKPWILYGLPKLLEAESVRVTEGEKCCDILNRYGFTTTTSMAGAKNAWHTDWRPLAGKRVTLWPDNDAEGRRYMADVEQILQTLQPPAIISFLEPTSLDLAEHEDAADFVQQLKVLGRTDAEITTKIAEALKKAKPLSIASEVQQRLADIKSGRYAAIDWPWSLLTSLTKSLLPGSVVILAGSPGASKSFMALQTFAYWHGQGLKVALYMIEENRVFHLTRCLAQRARQADFTDPQWIKENAELAGQIIADHKAFLDNFGRVLYASAEMQPTLQQLAAWVEERAKNGCRIIGIDAVTAADRETEPRRADSKFLRTIEKTVTDYSCSIILVSHPIKKVDYPDLSQLAGAAAYVRFAQAIFWLESHEPKLDKVRTPVGTDEMEHNRTLYILKARNGKGMGMKLAYQFDSESLTLSELGIIQRQRK
jgi:hypothetical protein